MWQSAIGFIAGYACRAQCGSFPCAASCKGSGAARPFKLSIVIHSATVETIAGPGLVQDQRPYVSIRINDKLKETELGDWSSEKEQWCFKEVITLEVQPNDEIFVACFPVFSVMPRLKPEDRDEDGIVWSSPIIPFDVREDGTTTARTYLSFETMQAPISSRGRSSAEGGCCQISKKWDTYDEDRYDSSPSTRESE
ncbi:unnamed protein product [Durusdinium trenchii]|uniref:C2 domain-containing protein n=1 Tax=Durusdinium trenchii TaxID=1381693 RepID=A0ABP0RN61_9DINO